MPNEKAPNPYDPPRPMEIRFSLTDVPGLYACSRCGGGVINIEVHRSWHMAGR